MTRTTSDAVGARADLRLGQLAPDFVATDTEGREHRLSQLVQAGPVALLFFPKSFAPSSWLAVRRYRDATAALAEARLHLLALSVEQAVLQRRFKAQLGASFPFIPDSGRRLAEMFGVLSPLGGFANRCLLVIDRAQRIRAILKGAAAMDPGAAVAACRDLRKESKPDVIS